MAEINNGMSWVDEEQRKVIHEFGHSTSKQLRRNNILLLLLIGVMLILSVLMILLITNTGVIGTYLSRAIC